MSAEDPRIQPRQRGGKRQKRRETCIQAQITAGHITEENFRGSRSLGSYRIDWEQKLLDRVPSLPVKIAEEIERVLSDLCFTEAQLEEVTVEIEAAGSLEEQHNILKRLQSLQTEVPAHSSTASSSSAAVPVETVDQTLVEDPVVVLPSSKKRPKVEIQLNSPVRAPSTMAPARALSTLAVAPILFALDLHNTLDDGSRKGRIPLENALAVKLLFQEGFLPWVCSYIGLHGKHSAERRELAVTTLASCATQAGLCPAPVEEPTDGYLCVKIVDRKFWSKHHPNDWENGKGSCLRELDTRILIDDNCEVRTDVESKYRILAYQVREPTVNIYKSYTPSVFRSQLCEPGRNLLFPTARADSFDHPISETFVEAVNRIFAEKRSGVLEEKLAALVA